MKKLLVLLLTVLMAMSLVACSSNEEKQEENNTAANMVNPMKEVESLDEVNQKAGINLVSIPVAGKDNEKYFVIESSDATVGQYNFTVNGAEYTLRGANYTEGDISGAYSDDNNYVANQETMVISNDFDLFRFFVDETQYTLYLAKQDGTNDDAFAEAAMEIKKLVSGEEDDPIVGSYQDSVSQRANAQVVKNGDVYEITVDWSSSAEEYTEWKMEATLNGEKLEYKGETIDSYKGEEVISTASNNAGYFDIIDGKLYWTGAAMEDCQACIFEKAE
ncbi:MAG: hypothetical protein Q4E33_00270 [Erysipelotrichaceae bacterium]|nr:hypothetical protein [Erysipelotrichaceae bacterium]